MKLRHRRRTTAHNNRTTLARALERDRRFYSGLRWGKRDRIPLNDRYRVPLMLNRILLNP